MSTATNPVDLWDFCNLSSGPATQPGGFDSRVLPIGAQAWTERAERVKDLVPETVGVVLFNAFGRFPLSEGSHMSMCFDQYRRAKLVRALRMMCSLSLAARAIHNIRSMGMQVRGYLGAPSDTISVEEFIDEVVFWAALDVPIYIDGNAIRPHMHRWMAHEFVALGGPWLGIEASPEVDSFLDSSEYPMFCISAAWDGRHRFNPGMLCHRGSSLLDEDGMILDGTLSNIVDQCREHNSALCMNLDPAENEQAMDDVLQVRELARGDGVAHA